MQKPITPTKKPINFPVRGLDPETARRLRKGLSPGQFNTFYLAILRRAASMTPDEKQEAIRNEQIARIQTGVK